MTYQVEAGGTVIGSSELEQADPGMGVLSGQFYPQSEYESVRSVFQLFADATSSQPANQNLLAEYYQRRDALELRLRDEEGRLIQTEWIHIVDFTKDVDSEAIELHVAVADRTFWDSRPPARNETP